MANTFPVIAKTFYTACRQAWMDMILRALQDLLRLTEKDWKTTEQNGMNLNENFSFRQARPGRAVVTFELA